MTIRLRFAIALAALGVLHIALPFHLEMTGLCCLALAAALALLELLHRKGARKTYCALLALTLLGSAAVAGATGYVALQEHDDLSADAPPSYVVVLGAQIHGDRPSRTLRERLDRAAAYLAQDPDTLCIVTGGQGADEQQTEASVMAAYLEAAGIDPARIVQETASTTTRENLQNAAAIAAAQGKDAARPLIVTSEYHLCRARYIARTLGLTASTLGSRTTPYLLKVNYDLREVFALVKAFFIARGA